MNEENFNHIQVTLCHPSLKSPLNFWKAPSNPNFHQKPPQIQIFTKSPLKSYCILPYFLVNTFNKELNEYLIYSKQFYLQNNQLAPFTRIMNISSAGLSLVCFGWRGQRPPPIIWGPPPYGGGDFSLNTYCLFLKKKLLFPKEKIAFSLRTYCFVKKITKFDGNV